MWKGIVASSRTGKGLTIEECQAYVNQIEFKPWAPSGGTLHNTAAPTLKQWMDYEALHPGQRILNLERYYRDDQHWSAGPHFFVDNNFIWPFTPINQSGVHSPSFNATKFGLEMVGDYDVEDDDTGEGYKAKRLAAAVFGMLYARRGLDPRAPGVFTMHRDDPHTTHACPGKDLFQDRAGFLDMIVNFMGSAGEHDHSSPLPIDYQPISQEAAPKFAALNKRVDPRVGADGLNMRAAASTSAAIIIELPARQPVAVYKAAMNGSTPWSYVWARTPDGQARTGWVASRYLS